MILDIKVSLFENYYSRTPYTTIGLWEWLLKDSENIVIVQRIRETRDEALKKKLKAKLPAITPSGIFSLRNVDGLVKHTGLICIDIDGKDNPHITDMELLKEELVKNEYILYCGLSVSGKGLYCMILIANPDKHKGHFYALEKDFAKLGITIDKACHDVTRLRGYSHDLKPILNPWSQIYQETIDYIETQAPKSMKNKDFITKNVEIQKTEPLVMTMDNFKQSVINQSLNNPSEYNCNVLIRSKSEMVRELVDKIVTSRIDITESRADWIQICSVLTNLFGEDGRDFFHQVSQFYSKYNQEINDQLYSNILEKGYRGNSDRLFEIAAKYGIR